MTRFAQKLATPVLTTLAALALVACGGGGGGSTSTPVNTTSPSGDSGGNSTPVGGTGDTAPSGDGGAGSTPVGGSTNPTPTPTPSPTPTITVDVTGGRVQAEANKSYLVQAPAATPVEIVLPASLAVGDTVTVTGLGAATWRITQNSGQAIQTDLLASDPALGTRWLESTEAQHWWTAAASGDGRVLAMAANRGSLYLSRDDGATWGTVSALPVANWSSIDMDPTGTFIVATNFGGGVWLSRDGGANWSSIAPAWTPPVGDAQWLGVTISDDGQRLAAVSKLGPVFTSVDGGQTWTQRLPDADWQSIAGSANGLILLAVSTNFHEAALPNGMMMVSTDGGATWTPREPLRHWYRVAMSADGQRMAAADAAGSLYLSTDGGVTWQARFPTGPVTEIGMSRDGQVLAVSVPAIAGGGPGGVYQSTDGGASWQQVRGTGVWRAAALSGDGRTLLAGNMGDGNAPWNIAGPGDAVGRIFVSRGHRTIYGTTGGLSGAQGDLVELTYRGNGRFEVTRSTGTAVAIP